MAYLNDSALERLRQRQRMLAGATPLPLGDPSPQQGVELPAMLTQQPMPEGIGELSLQNVLGSLSLTPKALDVKEQTPLQAPQMPRRVSAPGTSSWRTDDSLSKALGGLLGGGGGIRDMLTRLRAEQAARSAPTPSVVRGANLPPPPGTTQASPRPPGPSLEKLIPGLQKPFDPSQQVPNAAAIKAYYDERQPGPALTVTGKPEGSAAATPLASGAGESEILANQRKPYADQMETNPALKEKMAAIALAEEGNDPEARTALAESALNRGTSRNIASLDTVLDPRYYQPMHDGSGHYEAALARIRSDPALKAQVYADIDRAAKGGSNVSNLATDNASGNVAKNSATNQTPAWQAKNGESFFRKDINPDIHGAQNVARTKDWYNNTSAALVDEKPPGSRVADASGAVPPQAPPGQTPGGPPGWLADTLRNDAQLRGVPPGTNLGSVDASPAPAPQAQLTPEALQQYGARQLAQRPNLAGTPDSQSPPPLTQAPGQPAINSSDPVMPPGRQNLKSALWAATDSNPPQAQATPSAAPPLTAQALLAKGRQQLAPGMVERGNIDLNNRPVVKNPDGTISTVRSIGVNVDGKELLLPTVSPDGKNLTNDQAVQLYRQTGQHLGAFDSPKSSEDYAQQLHLDQAQQYAQPPTAPQMTPQLAKAIVGAVDAKDLAAAAPPSPPGAQPVLAPTDVAPPAPGAPGGPAAAPGAPTMPAGNAPVMMTQASQGNPIAMAGLSPVAPVQPTAPLSTPLTAQATPAFPNALQPPIPYSDMQGWGWSSPDVSGGGWGGWSGGGFDGGLGGGDG